MAAAYGIALERIARVPVPSMYDGLPLPGPEELETVVGRYGLPSAFAVFPAQAWPHKNHRGLLRALARLRERHGLRVPLVCTGASGRSVLDLARLAETLGIGDQVLFLGFIPASDLRCIYRLGRMLIFPSLFEGWGFPVVEAMAEGVAVACSNRTSLPEAADDAALLFDPEDDSAMDDAIARLWTDGDLRATLSDRGGQRASRLSWRRTARVYRALYRAAAGRSLTFEDEALIAETAI